MNDLSRAKDRVSTKRIAALLDGGPLDQVHGPSHDRRYLVLHLHDVEETYRRVLLERDEQIDIAVRAEVIA